MCVEIGEDRPLVQRWGDWTIMARTRRGTKRDQLQDAFAMADDLAFRGQTVAVLAVFDGLGGIPNGEKASAAAANGLALAVESAGTPRGLIRRLNDAVLRTRGATTAAIALLPHDSRRAPTCVSIGDTAIFTLDENGGLVEMTPRDQVDRVHLTDYLGRLGAYGHVRIAKNASRILICSDGVHAVADRQDILQCLSASPKRLAQAFRRLFDVVDKNGRPDDATAILAVRNP